MKNKNSILSQTVRLVESQSVVLPEERKGVTTAAAHQPTVARRM